MPFTGTYWSTKELQDLLGVSRQRIHDLKYYWDWKSPAPGIYEDEDVQKYLRLRATKLKHRKKEEA